MCIYTAGTDIPSAGARAYSKRMQRQASQQAEATAAADAGAQAAILAATAGRKAAALHMKKKQAQLAPVKGAFLVLLACFAALCMQ